MINFEFATANRIIFGAGKFKEAGEIAASFGKRAFIVTGGASGDEPFEQLAKDLSARNIPAQRFIVKGEPSLQTMHDGLAAAREHGADVAIGLGGGSAMDTAKCIAGLLTNEGDLLDYLEVVGQGKPLTKPAAPVICIPTTAGTGAEVTRNSVISVPDKQVKVSIRSPYLLPRVALVDPELTYSLPPDVTAYTGLDALTQLIEPFVSFRATFFTDMLCKEGLIEAGALLTAFYGGSSQTPSVTQAREKMSLASLFGGLALANSGLGAVHGFAAVLGARYPIPHGACCGILLPYVVDANASAPFDHRKREDFDYDAVHRLLGASIEINADKTLVDTLYRIVRELNMPTLSHYGITADAIPELVQLSKKASSMKANPVELTDDELSGILRAAL